MMVKGSVLTGVSQKTRWGPRNVHLINAATAANTCYSSVLCTHAIWYFESEFGMEIFKVESKF